MTPKELLVNLKEMQIIKHGDFLLKSGTRSSIYVDLRTLIGYPILLREVSHCLWEKTRFISYQRICGVPYTALPMATCISIDHAVPMVFVRKEVKSYGTKKKIEGIFHVGEQCVLIEDVVTTGTSVLEIATSLETEGLVVKDIVTVVERDPSVRERFYSKGYTLHSLFTLDDLL